MSLRVLVIDDDEVLARSLERMLRRAGFDACYAIGPLAGLMLFEEMRPEVVVCDYLMPDMNGLQVTREIRERSSRVKCVLMTGSDEIECHSEIPVLLKPFDSNALLAALA